MSEVAGGDPKQDSHSLQSNPDELEEDNRELVGPISTGSINTSLEVSTEQAGSSQTSTHKPKFLNLELNHRMAWVGMDLRSF